VVGFWAGNALRMARPQSVKSSFFILNWLGWYQKDNCQIYK